MTVGKAVENLKMAVNSLHAMRPLIKNDTFERAFIDWKQQAVLLNQRLTPLVNDEVDINVDDWVEKSTQRPHPADVSKLRLQITALFNETINQFEFYNSDQRQQIVDLMHQNDDLMYATVLDADRNTPNGFRKYMILIVIDDQGKDTSDAVLSLGHSYTRAEKQGVNVGSIFIEMAAISSTDDKFGWRSPRDLFL